MVTVEQGAGAGQGPDVTLLKDMVGVQKALRLLVERKLPLTKDAVVALLEAQQEVYSSEGLFVKKGQALREIITALEQGTLSVEEIFRGAGISTVVAPPQKSGLAKLWDKIRGK